MHEQQIDDSQLNQNNEISVDQVLASEHQPAPQLDPDTRSIDATANKPLEKINSSSETSSETKEVSWVDFILFNTFDLLTNSLDKLNFSCSC